MWRSYKYLAAASDLCDFVIVIWLSADKSGIIYNYAHALDMNIVFETDTCFKSYWKTQLSGIKSRYYGLICMMILQ